MPASQSYPWHLLHFCLNFFHHFFRLFFTAFFIWSFLDFLIVRLFQPKAYFYQIQNLLCFPLFHYLTNRYSKLLFDASLQCESIRAQFQKIVLPSGSWAFDIHIYLGTTYSSKHYSQTKKNSFYKSSARKNKHEMNFIPNKHEV